MKIDDFKKSRQRFNGWWEGECIDRALIQVWAPNKEKDKIWMKYGNGVGAFNPRSILKKWKDKDFDNDFLVSFKKKLFSSVHFAGDAFPSFGVTIGPGSIAAYLGCKAEFREDTIWFGPPILKDYSNIGKIALEENQQYWRITRDITRDAISKSNGEYFVNAADLGMGLDTIASLRGTQQLLIDLIENPHEVKSLIDAVSDIFITCYDELYDIVKGSQQNFLGYLPVFCEGRNYPLQCDFSAMISPGMFEEFVVPDLVKISKALDRRIYHLDGPDATRHLDIILDIKEIDAIQWVPGAGAPSAVNWIPMLRKIQKKNKSILVYAENMTEIKKLMQELEPKGLLISTRANSREEAAHIVKEVTKLSVKK